MQSLSKLDNLVLGTNFFAQNQQLVEREQLHVAASRRIILQYVQALRSLGLKNGLRKRFIGVIGSEPDKRNPTREAYLRG